MSCCVPRFLFFLFLPSVVIDSLFLIRNDCLCRTESESGGGRIRGERKLCLGRSLSGVSARARVHDCDVCGWRMNQCMYLGQNPGGTPEQPAQPAHPALTAAAHPHADGSQNSPCIPSPVQPVPAYPPAMPASSAGCLPIQLWHARLPPVPLYTLAPRSCLD